MVLQFLHRQSKRSKPSHRSLTTQWINRGDVRNCWKYQAAKTITSCAVARAAEVKAREIRSPWWSGLWAAMKLKKRSKDAHPLVAQVTTDRNNEVLPAVGRDEKSEPTRVFTCIARKSARAISRINAEKKPGRSGRLGIRKPRNCESIAQ